MRRLGEAGAMKIRYHSYHGGGSHDAHPAYDGASTVVVASALCANADCDAGNPLVIAGVKGTDSTKNDGTGTEAEAGCVRCGQTIGRIVVTFETIFGREEDSAVLNGRPRVY